MNKVSHTILPPPAHSRRAARALKLLPIAALLAAGAAQAQVTGISITGIDPSATDCKNVLFDINIAGTCGTPPCFSTGSSMTFSQNQGGTVVTGTEDWGPAPYPFVASTNPLGGLGFTPAPPSDLDPALPFTVTWTVVDGSNTFSATVGVSGCVNPSIVPTFPTTATATGDGTISCTPDPVLEGDTVECSATANPGSVLETLEISDGVNPPVSCTTSPCSLAGVKGNVTAKATFTAPTPTPPTPYHYSDDSSPTLGELGLLLSGLALAGAAAPALRRREKRSKKG